MSLIADGLASTMLEAAKNSLGVGWSEAKPLAETEFSKIAIQIVDIEAQLNAGTVTQEKAALLLDMQKQASRTVLLTIEGIGLVAAQAAINASLQAVRGLVNDTLKFSLL